MARTSSVLVVILLSHHATKAYHFPNPGFIDRWFIFNSQRNPDAFFL